MSTSRSSAASGRTSQRHREQAAALAGLAAQLVRAVEDRVDLPPYTPIDIAIDPDGPPEAAEDAADHVRKLWQIPDGPIDNVIRLLERHGIVVFRAPLASNDALSATNVDAYSWAGGPRPIVTLGTEKDVYERSRLDAAHELAHILLHAADPAPADKALERQAQRFAGALLAPAELFAELWPAGRLDWSYLLRLRQRLGLSLGALLHRAKDLNLITPAAYLNAIKYMSRRGWRTHEPGPHLPVEQPALLNQALHLLDQHDQPLAQLAATAHLGTPEALTRALGLDPRPSLRVDL